MNIEDRILEILNLYYGEDVLNNSVVNDLLVVFQLLIGELEQQKNMDFKNKYEVWEQTLWEQKKKEMDMLAWKKKQERS